MSQETTTINPETLKKQINARRTFAIISHPDAGKTTLTEKLLLYGNAIHLAGSVRARRNQRSATSDWMKVPPCGGYADCNKRSPRDDQFDAGALDLFALFLVDAVGD